MKLSKIFLICAMLSLTGVVFAQSADDFGFGGGNSDFEFSGDDSGFGGFDSSSGSSASPLSVSGKVEAAGRAYVAEEGHRDSPGDWKMDIFPKALLDLNYSAASSDLNLKVKLDKTSLLKYQWDILDEFTARAYMGALRLEAGKMRVVWGKGDKVHVLDNFNANDYMDFLVPDYIDRRISELMFRAEYTTPNGIRFEGIWTPVMTADRLADSGVWQPKKSKQLTNIAKTAVANNIGTNPSGSSIVQYASFNSSNLLPDTYQLKYGQAGLRSTFTIGSVDLGLSYYYGHYKQPSADMSKYIAAGGSQVSTNNAFPSLDYDAVNIFGIEGAAVLFRMFNTRWELAYNMTNDFAGDDPWVHNNSISWVFGFDFDIPLNNLNLNIQTTGTCILNYNKIKDADYGLTGTKAALSPYYKAADVDYDSEDKFTNNKIIIAITDSYLNEKIKTELKGIWGIERGDIIIMPDVQLKVKDEFVLDMNGMFIWCNNSNSEFDGWQNNSFIQIGAKYSF